MDTRSLASNGHVAAVELRGQVTADKFVDGTVMQVAATSSDLLGVSDPKRRERQLLFGDHFRVLEYRDHLAFGQAKKDGYVGWIAADDLDAAVDATHVVISRGTHLYAQPDIKCRDALSVSLCSRLRVVGGHGDLFETHDGRFVPKPHLRPANAPLGDPASVAQLLFGTPYLWGGNSNQGIDCSGLVQVAFLMCGVSCPSDSDQQEMSLGEPIDIKQVARGDLLFWKGHVAMAVDDTTLIHANAHSMSVTYESIDEAIARIRETGGGAITCCRRVSKVRDG